MRLERLGSATNIALLVVGLNPALALFQLVAMQAELERTKEENQKLRAMLNQVTSNYNALQMHLVALVQQRRASGNPQGHDVRTSDPISPIDQEN